MLFTTVKIKYHNYGAMIRKQNINPPFILKEAVSFEIKYYLSYMNAAEFIIVIFLNY